MGEPCSPHSGDPASVRSWCLRRVGVDAEWLLLEDGREVSIGRGFGVTYQLVSKMCPLMISRNHCVLKQNPEGQWTIMDNKSLNGVWLNRERLEPLKFYFIREGDHIQLGVPLQNEEHAEYEYEVTEEDWERMFPCLAPKSNQMMEKNKGLRTKRKSSADELEGLGYEGPSHLKSKISKVSCEPDQPVKSPENGKVASQPSEYLDPGLASLEASEKTTRARTYPGPPKVTELYHKKQKASKPSASQSSLELFKVTMSRIMKLKRQLQEKQVAVMNVKKQTRRGSAKKIVKMEQELQELQSQLCTEQAQQQARVDQLEKTFQEEEKHLQGLEKEQVEDLKQQLAQALQEHQALMEELNRSKKDFETIIQAKNKELEQTKEEKEKVQAQKEEVLSHMNDVLENELQCIICSEYFIEAVTLNCAHSFCSYCISEWMKRKIECPICRKDIKSKTRSLVLDSCIDKMVDNLSSEVKERRTVLIRERKVLGIRPKALRTPGSPRRRVWWKEKGKAETQEHWFSKWEREPAPKLQEEAAAQTAKAVALLPELGHRGGPAVRRERSQRGEVLRGSRRQVQDLTGASCCPGYSGPFSRLLLLCRIPAQINFQTHSPRCPLPHRFCEYFDLDVGTSSSEQALLGLHRLSPGTFKVTSAAALGPGGEDEIPQHRALQSGAGRRPGDHGGLGDSFHRRPGLRSEAEGGSGGRGQNLSGLSQGPVAAWGRGRTVVTSPSCAQRGTRARRRGRRTRTGYSPSPLSVSADRGPVGESGRVRGLSILPSPVAWAPTRGRDSPPSGRVSSSPPRLRSLLEPEPRLAHVLRTRSRAQRYFQLQRPAREDASASSVCAGGWLCETQAQRKDSARGSEPFRWGNQDSPSRFLSRARSSGMCWSLELASS
ncbi:E3 ubiquitin-protein ligase RNF8 [Erethizon dorsatum]